MSEPIDDPPKKALVSVRNLHKTFIHMGRPLHVLRGIDLDLGEGEVVAIVGRSGAGKSTLLHCIGTLDLPSSGSIRLATHDLVGLDSARLAAIRNAMIGFVFQFHHLLPEFNALENVMMPGLIQGRSRTEMVRRGEMLLSEVGLSHRATHRPGELSGGEQQRVALARALVLEPKLILADEPTGNLDTTTSDAIHQLFFDVNRRHGTTIVVVTHNVAFAQGMPRVVTMSDGQIFSDQRIEPKGPPSSAITAVAPDPASIPGASSQPSQTEPSQPGSQPESQPGKESPALSEPDPVLDSEL